MNSPTTNTIKDCFEDVDGIRLASIAAGRAGKSSSFLANMLASPHACEAYRKRSVLRRAIRRALHVDALEAPAALRLEMDPVHFSVAEMGHLRIAATSASGRIPMVIDQPARTGMSFLTARQNIGALLDV